MATKQERDLEAELGPSPWPMYADEEEPWKDHERMLKLDAKFDYQYEIAHVLGTTGSTVSYWLKKAKENYTPEVTDEDLKCEYFEVCHNETPGPNNGCCDNCLAIVRHNNSARGDDIDATDFETMNDYIAELYDHYDADEVLW